MSSPTREEGSIPDFVSQPIRKFHDALSRSLTLSVAAIGVLMIAVGAVIPHGTVAGMFGIWGISAILFGITAYVLLWLNRLRFARS